MTDFFWKLYFTPQISSHLHRYISTVRNFRVHTDTVLDWKAVTSRIDPKVLNLLSPHISQKLLPKYTAAQELRPPEMEPYASAHPSNDPCVTCTYLYTIPWGFRSLDPLLPEHRHLSFIYKRCVLCVYMWMFVGHMFMVQYGKDNFPQDQFSCL